MEYSLARQAQKRKDCPVPACENSVAQILDMRTEGEAHCWSTLALEGRREMGGETSIFLVVLLFVFLV